MDPIAKYKAEQAVRVERDYQIGVLTRAVGKAYLEVKFAERNADTTHTTILYEGYHTAVNKVYDTAVAALVPFKSVVLCYLGNPTLWRLYVRMFGKPSRGITWAEAENRLNTEYAKLSKPIQANIDRGLPAPLKQLIPTKQWHAERLDKYVQTYAWFKKKENRFKFDRAADGFLATALYEAYDAGVTDFEKFVLEQNYIEMERELAYKQNELAKKYHQAGIDRYNDAIKDMEKLNTLFHK